MNTVMTPVCLFLLFLSVTAAPRGALVDEPQEEPVVDLESTVGNIELVNTNLSKLLSDGDIMPNNRRNAAPCASSGCRWPKSRGRVYVPYIISSSYTTDKANIIINALETININTCVRFVKKTWQRDYIYFYPGTGCWSYVGRIGGMQRISLQDRGCVYKGTTQHEALHALGFHHEQARSDRDRYVKILTENIRTGTERNFAKTKTNNLGSCYDFDSVMHYSKYAFSKNGKPTIVAKRSPNREIGTATEMSEADISRINRLYRCRV